MESAVRSEERFVIDKCGAVCRAVFG